MIYLIYELTESGEDMEIGRRIVSLREKRGWTQKELANRVKLNVSVMNRIELNERPVKDNELLNLANVLEVSTDYLLGRTNQKNTSDYEIQTIAAHHDGDEWTEEELEEIERFKEFVRMKKRGNKQE